jgi:hypothetical protein
MTAGQEHLKEEMRAWRKETKARWEATEACLEKAKAKPEKTQTVLEEMGAAEDVFEEKLDRMDTTDLKDNRGMSEASGSL